MKSSWNEIEKNLRETYLQRGEDQAVMVAKEQVMDRIRKLDLPQTQRENKSFLAGALSWYSQICAYVILALIFVWGLQTLHKDLQTSISTSFYATRFLPYGE